MCKENHDKGKYVNSHRLTRPALDRLRESFSALVNIKEDILMGFWFNAMQEQSTHADHSSTMQLLSISKDKESK